MKLVPIKSLKPASWNPRLIKDEHFKSLCKSIKNDPEFMELRPILATKDGTIYAGNMRYRACQELGWKEVPAIFTDIDDIKAKERAVKDNNGFGEWDDTLSSLIDELEKAGVEIDTLGLDSTINDILAEQLEAEEDDFDIEPPEKPITVMGDIYEIGNHRLICGDSTKTDTFCALMKGELADMVITDPPYNVAYEGKTKDALTIKNDSMGNEDFYQFLYDFYTAQSTVVKKGAAIYVWHASSEVINFGKAMVDAGWLLKQQLIWVKNAMVMGRQDYQWKHEPCLYGWLAGDSHKWYSDRKQTTVIEWDKPQRNGEHPTMKPVGLFSYQIQNSSRQGDIVIDPFGGSGTTMIACEQLKRIARVIEFDSRYCDVIIKRMLKLDPSLVIKRNGEVTNDFI